MLQRALWLLVAAIVIGVLVAVLPLPGVVSTIGYAAAVICGVVGIVFLIVGLARGARL